MKNKIATVFIVIVLTFFTATSFAVEDDISYLNNFGFKIGNRSIEFQYPVFIREDRIYVPIRNLCNELGIPITYNGEENEVVMDINNKKLNISDKTEIKEGGVIPDEKTALSVGKAILEAYAGKSLEYETDEKIYYLRAKYLENTGVWSVVQWFDFKDGRKWAASGIYIPCVNLSKATGEVLYINTYSTLTNAN